MSLLAHRIFFSYCAKLMPVDCWLKQLARAGDLALGAALPRRRTARSPGLVRGLASTACCCLFYGRPCGCRRTRRMVFVYSCPSNVQLAGMAAVRTEACRPPTTCELVQCSWLDVVRLELVAAA